MDEKNKDLEERIAALEGLSQERQKQWDELVNDFEDTIINFCIDFHIPVPERLRQKAQRL